MTKPKLKTRIIPGTETNLFWYIAEIGGKVIAKERVPLHVMKMEGDRQEFHLRQIAAKLAKRIPRGAGV